MEVAFFYSPRASRRHRSSALIGRVCGRRGSSCSENGGYKYRPRANAAFIPRAGPVSRAHTSVRRSQASTRSSSSSHSRTPRAHIRKSAAARRAPAAAAVIPRTQIVAIQTLPRGRSRLKQQPVQLIHPREGRRPHLHGFLCFRTYLRV